MGEFVNKTEARLRRSGTSRNIHHAADSLHDSLDATMQIERMVEEHGPAWTISALQAMVKSSDRDGIRAAVERIAGGERD